MKISSRHSNSITRIAIILIVILSVGYFWSTALYRISDAPGIFLDEACNALPALESCCGVFWMQGPTLQGVFTDTVRIPLTKDTMSGFVEAYVLLPFLKVGGLHLAVIRFFSVLFAFLAVAALSVAAYNIFGLYSAIFFLALILTNSLFIIHSRTGIIGAHSTLWLATGIAFLSFSFYERTKKRLWMYLGFISLGLGAYAHLRFLFFVIGVIAAMLFLDRARIRQNAKVYFFCLFAFLIGFSPFVISNIFSHFSDIKLILEKIFESGPSHGSGLIQNIILTGKQLCQLDIVQCWGNAAPEMSTKYNSIFIFLPLFCFVFQPIRRQLGEHKKYLFFMILTVLIYLIGISIGLYGVRSKHVLPIIPVLYLIDAAVLSAVVSYAKTRSGLLARSIMLTLTAILGLNFMLQAAVLHKFFLFNRDTGGITAYGCSYAQQQLSTFLLDHGIRPLSFYPAITFPVAIYSGSKIRPIQVQPVAADILEAHRRHPYGTFLGFASENSNRYSKDFPSELQKTGLKQIVKRNFPDKNGNNIYCIFRLSD